MPAINTLRPRQHGRHFPDDIFKYIFLNENVWILIKISLKFVPKGLINNIIARHLSWIKTQLLSVERVGCQKLYYIFKARNMTCSFCLLFTNIYSSTFVTKRNHALPICLFIIRVLETLSSHLNARTIFACHSHGLTGRKECFTTKLTVCSVIYNTLLFKICYNIGMWLKWNMVYSMTTCSAHAFCLI